MAAVTRLIPGRTVFLVCDIQTRFRPLIHGFDHVVATSARMLRFAKVLNVPIVITEQNPRALGSTAPELDAAPLGNLLLGVYDKTAFSMAIPPVTALLKKHDFKSIVLFGIESHVCILQSALDLLKLGYDVHVLADGVSSSRQQEVPIALARMRQAGAQITTSETVAFELQVDSNKPNFKDFSRIIKEEAGNRHNALDALLPPDSRL